MRVGLKIVHEGMGSSRGKLRRRDLDSGEMNVLRSCGYVDSENTWSGVVTDPNQVLGVRDDGTTMNTSSCRIITIRASHERRERGM